MLVTTNTKNREKIFIDPVYAYIALESIYRTQERQPFFLYGFVIMPDHCHLLIRVPEEGAISRVMYAYKRSVSFELGKGPIWQPRFHSKIAENPSGALHYIHWNPVKAKLCEMPENYPWSSAYGKWDVMELEWIYGI